jgi:hypothetical protein
MNQALYAHMNNKRKMKKKKKPIYLFMYSFFPLLLCWVEVYCGIYKGSYTYNLSTISYLISPFPPLSFLSPLPIHETVSVGNIFAFTCMCTHILHLIHSPTPFPTTSPLPLVPKLAPGQYMFHPPVLWSCRREKIKKKNMTFFFASLR